MPPSSRPGPYPGVPAASTGRENDVLESKGTTLSQPVALRLL